MRVAMIINPATWRTLQTTMKAQRVELQSVPSGERLDKTLAELIPELSRVQWQRLIQDGQVLVNGKPAKASLRLSGDETIEADIPESAESDLTPEEIPLDIRYEDDDIIVINKPAGMVVHPGTGHAGGTLVNALLAHCPGLEGIGDTKRPGIVHRLDKDTSGLIVVAKHDRAMRHLQAQFKKRAVEKRYIALVEGQIQPPSALIDAPIGRDPAQRKKMAVIAPGSPRFSSAQSREAQTRYKSLSNFDEFTLVECAPITGRTHQIRVHLAFAGFPIVGDKVYGRRKQRLPLKRHFLHAAQLTLRRPAGETELTFTAELPVELQQIIDGLNQ
jgi:23S rRNA pseudouridine1911/1915/1917 synthase